jgi:ribosomal protein S6
VTPSNYSSSNFDRGHNIPSDDRTATVAANSSTFLMTNMIPQAPQFNQQPWANMESYIRAQVGTTNEAYIYMGNYGVGGVGTNNVVTNSIGAGVVNRSQERYKIVVLLPKGGDDLNRIDTSARMLAVDMPNDNRLYTGVMNNYELMVIFTPVLSDDFKSAQKKFTLRWLPDNGGSIVAENPWGLKSLAYPIQKKTTGLYWVVEFTAPSDFNEKLKIQLLRDESFSVTCYQAR